MSNNRQPYDNDYYKNLINNVGGKVAEGIGKAVEEVGKAIKNGANNNYGSNGKYNAVNPPIDPPYNNEQQNYGSYAPPPVAPPPPRATYKPPPPPPRATYKPPPPPRSYTPPPPKNADGAYRYVPPQRNRRNTNESSWKPTPPIRVPKEKKPRKFHFFRTMIPISIILFFGERMANQGYRIPLLIIIGISIGLLVAEICKVIAYNKRVAPTEVIRKKVVEKVVEKAPPKPEPVKKEKISNTGNPELDKIIDSGNQYIVKLRAANVSIQDEGVSNSLDRMEKACKGIFDYVLDKPEQIPQIKKFMNYYLPTTLKLLASYEKLSRQAVKGENISSTMFDIEGMMKTIATAFEKQLDGLFSSDAMDIQADISVFESILMQEGLKDNEEFRTK